MSRSLKSRTRKQLTSLSARKTKIEQLIEQEAGNRLPCSLTLQHLKKLRLNIKDRIASLQFWPGDQNFGRG